MSNVVECVAMLVESTSVYAWLVGGRFIAL